jgi:DNA-binding NarL/FixJ family response regulator
VGIKSVDQIDSCRGLALALILIRAGTRVFHKDIIAFELTFVRMHCPGVPIVLYSVNDEVANLLAGIEAGPQGILPPTVSLLTAGAALQVVMQGGTYSLPSVSQPAAQQLAMRDIAPSQTVAANEDRRDSMREANKETIFLKSVDCSTDHVESGAPHASFTCREMEVLHALRQGRSNKWIASHLQISENTTKVHVRNIMRKLNVTSRTEAVVLTYHGTESVSVTPNIAG